MATRQATPVDETMAAAGDGNPATTQMHPAAASFSGQPLPLTEHNLKQLQPYIIRPMSPVTVSSSHSQSNDDRHCATDCDVSHGSVDDADNGDQEEATDGMEPTAAAMAAAAARKAEADAKGEHGAARDVARFRFWVYNAMQALLDLGPEGVAIVEADELYIAGPGDVRLKPRGPGDEAISGRVGVDKQVVPVGGNAATSNTKNVSDADAACPQNHELLPNLMDPRYWRNKMRHLTHLCKPLSQARRLERRLTAKNEAANHSLREELRDDARMDAWRAEQSRLLYRDKHSRIVKWALGLDAQTYTRPSTPIYDEADQAMALRRRGETFKLERRSYEVAAGPFVFKSAPPSSDSSIVEITPVQFVEATRDRDRQNTPQAFTAQTTEKGTRASTMAPTTAPTTATNCNSEQQPEAKKQRSTRSSPQSTATQRTRAAQPPLVSTLLEQPKEPFTKVPQPTAAKHSGVETETHTSHSRAGVLGERQRGASEDNEPHN